MRRRKALSPCQDPPALGLARLRRNWRYVQARQLRSRGLCVTRDVVKLKPGTGTSFREAATPESRRAAEAAAVAAEFCLQCGGGQGGQHQIGRAAGCRRRSQVTTDFTPFAPPELATAGSEAPGHPSPGKSGLPRQFPELHVLGAKIGNPQLDHLPRGIPLELKLGGKLDSPRKRIFVRLGQLDIAVPQVRQR